MNPYKTKNCRNVTQSKVKFQLLPASQRATRDINRLWTHQCAVCLHIGMLRVGVLGIDGDHHLVSCLVPVMSTCHLLLILSTAMNQLNHRGVLSYAYLAFDHKCWILESDWSKGAD